MFTMFAIYFCDEQRSAMIQASASSQSKHEDIAMNTFAAIASLAAASSFASSLPSEYYRPTPKTSAAQGKDDKRPASH